MFQFALEFCVPDFHFYFGVIANWKQTVIITQDEVFFVIKNQLKNLSKSIGMI